MIFLRRVVHFPMCTRTPIYLNTHFHMNVHTYTHSHIIKLKGKSRIIQLQDQTLHFCNILKSTFISSYYKIEVSLLIIQKISPSWAVSLISLKNVYTYHICQRVRTGGFSSSPPKTGPEGNIVQHWKIQGDAPFHTVKTMVVVC